MSSFLYYNVQGRRTITMNFLKHTISYFTQNTGGKMLEKYMNQEEFPETIEGLSKDEKYEYCEAAFNILKTMSKDFEGENVSEMELQEDEKRWLTNLVNIFLELNEETEDNSDDDSDDEDDIKSTIRKMETLKSSIQMTILEEVFESFRKIGNDDETTEVDPEKEKEQEKVFQELRAGRVTSSYVLGMTKKEQMEALIKEKNIKGELVFQSYNDAEKFYDDTIFRYHLKKCYVGNVPKETLVTQIMTYHNLGKQEAEQECEKIIKEYLDDKKRYDDIVRSNL